MEYRAEIDGLRALAVVPVILFHAGFYLFSGGYVGVDIFFVISGYLITTILVNDIEKDCFSVCRFYERRIRRILPALVFVVMFFAPFAWWLLLPNQMVDFSKSLIAVCFFSSNFLFWQENDYFNAVSEETPLLHTWSLAVEEQYYLVFPVLLYFVWRIGKGRALTLLVIFMMLSLVLSEWGSRYYPVANFYLTPYRVWELFAGSITAFAAMKWGVKSNNILSVVGLAAILYSVFLYDESTPFPGFYALLPVIGTILVIVYAGEQTLVARWLSGRVLVGLGLISYSAYLWHQPLFAFARIGMINEPSPILMGLLSILAIVLAYFSWKYVEYPFRSASVVGKKSVYILSFISIGSITAFGIGGVVSNGYSNYRYSEDEMKMIDENALRGVESDFLGAPGVAPLWVLLGDSHANALQEAFDESLSKYNQSASVMTINGCPPALDLWRQDMSYGGRCTSNYESSLERIKNSDIDKALISARFALYMNGDRFNNGEGGVEIGQTERVIFDHVKYKSENRSDLERREQIERQLIRFVRALSNLGVTVYIIKSIPEVGWYVPELALRNYGSKKEIKTNYNAYLKRTDNLENLYNNFEEIPNVIVLDSSAVFCDEFYCYATKDGYPLYSDTNHLSKEGARMLIEYYNNILFHGIGKPQGD